MLVSIAVFGLFHSSEFWVRPATSQAVRVETESKTLTLEGRRIAKFYLGQTGPLRVMRDFQLIIPGKIDRRFRGVLHITPAARELIATIDMDLEDAVASVIAAESVPGAGLEALKAQAVVARSFYTASPRRHQSFDFCDTTHCQFLRAIPAAGTLALQAAEETRGLVLTYHDRPFAAFYSAACGGWTRALERSTGYPYFAVNCDYCQRHPTQPVRGHRLGMCQSGAAGMAADGASFRTILNHYYPATTLRQASSSPPASAQHNKSIQHPSTQNLPAAPATAGSTIYTDRSARQPAAALGGSNAAPSYE